MSKSRSERGKTPPFNQNAPPPSPAAIVPGKFFESDWNKLMSEEASEDFISSIINEIVNQSSKLIYEKEIDARVQPYAVSAARRMLLEVIEWHFLAFDKGDFGKGCNYAWTEDEEPESVLVDSWAQGAVPFMKSPSLHDNLADDSITSYGNAAPIDKAKDLTDETCSNCSDDEKRAEIVPEGSRSTCGMQAQCCHNEDQDDIDHPSPTGEAIYDALPPKEVTPKPPAKPQESEVIHRRFKFKPYRGKLPKFQSMPSSVNVPTEQGGLDARTNNLDCKAASLLHSHDRRFAGLGQKDISDPEDCVARIPKLNLNKLPTHRVKIGYAIVEPCQEPSWGPHRSKVKRATKPATSSTLPAGLKDANMDVVTINSGLERSIKTPLPPPLVDSIAVLSAGVVMHEAGIVKRGPRQVHLVDVNEADRLFPISSTRRERVLTSKDVVPDGSLLVRPFSSGRTLPEIFSPCE